MICRYIIPHFDCLAHSAALAPPSAQLPASQCPSLLCRRFVRQETELFKLRYKKLELAEERMHFYNAMGLDYSLISEAQFPKLQTELAAVARSVGASDSITLSDFKLFYEVRPLLALLIALCAR